MLTQLSALGVFWRRLMTPPPVKRDGYRVYTKAFDRTVRASDIAKILPDPGPKTLETFKENVNTFEIEFESKRRLISSDVNKFIDDLRADLSMEARGGHVVSFLIDHSGSMRGEPMLSALFAVDTSVAALTDAGVHTEILGFTTASWRGGQSRLAWEKRGKPRNPGRLCDLLHIVYREASCSTHRREDLHPALRLDLLHENIDGEALAWAASRLDRRRWSRRTICLISDGAPVDDSTLSANEDDRLLVRHLRLIEERTRAEGIPVTSLRIDSRSRGEPERRERSVTEPPEAVALSLLDVLRRALLPADPP